MRLRVGLIVAIVLGLLAVGILVTVLAELRIDSSRKECENHLRELSLFAIAATTDRPDAKPVFASEKDKTERPRLQPRELERIRKLGLPSAIPAGTIANPALPPERRLGWTVGLLPGIDQRRQDLSGVLAAIDKAQAWDAEANATARQTVIRGLLCPGNSLETAVTQYVGNGGVGSDAATLPATDPKAGCFRYDASTPLDAIGDGLSQSVLFAEVNQDAGPWLQGGPATVKTLDIAKPAIGFQFGGNHPGGANFGMADGSIRFLTPRTDPAILAALFTINGGPGPTLE